MSQSLYHSYILDNTVVLYSQCSAVLRNDHEPYTQWEEWRLNSENEASVVTVCYTH
jgi:hypothetical protein